MTSLASDHARGSRARCRSVAAILGAGLLLTSAGAIGAAAKTPTPLPKGKAPSTVLPSGTAMGAGGGTAREYVADELLVRFRSGADRSQARRAENAKFKRQVRGVDDLEVLKLERGRDPEAAARSFERRSDVLYAEPNYIYQKQATTTDSRLSQYWGHNNTGQAVNGTTGIADADMDIFEAWNIQQSSPNVLVAVIDTGVAYDHPDLAPNMWLNVGESCTAALPNRCKNGVDDDGNGYVDDVRGYDSVNDDGDPRDDDGHGTHVAGTIAARGNNDLAGANATDGVGVSTQAKIVAVKVLGPAGGSNESVTEGIVYAAKRGVKIANMSLGGGDFSQAMSDAIKNAPNTLFMIAAGNGGQDGVGDNNDTLPYFPCNYTSLNIICVAASNQSDQFTSFSNYGATHVDIAAPGQNILSTMPAFRTLFTDNFELDPFAASRWTRGGTPNTWNWTDEVFAGDSGHSLTDSPGAEYASDTDNWARRTSASNLSNVAACALDFITLFDTEDEFDYLLVEAATNPAGDWALMGAFTGFGNGRANVPLDDEFDQFSGKSAVYVRFALVSDEDITFDGAYIDNLALKCIAKTGYNGTDFAYNNGTSMATPYAAGVAALLFGKFPTLTVAQARTRLLQSVDVKAALNQAGKKVATGGRLNAYKALAQTTAGVASGVLNVTAGKGTDNNLVVTRIVEGGIVKYRVTDLFSLNGTTGSRVVPGAGCVAVAGALTTVKCNAAGITRVKVLADDMDDSVNTSTVTVPVTLDGGLGVDFLTSGTGADTLLGQAGNDTLTSGGGNDTLTSGDGADTLTSGDGADTLTGGLGADKFTAGFGNDTINAKDDALDLSPFACGENTNDSDKVNADSTPNDPVTQSLGNCEVVGKT